MNLTDIPLSIHGVQGSSAVFRYTDVFPPIATVYRPDNELIKENKNYLILSENVTSSPKYVTPLDVCLQLSTSGKWPNELEAFRKTKAAFHLQIAGCLRKQYMLVVNANYSHVDVYKVITFNRLLDSTTQSPSSKCVSMFYDVIYGEKI